MTVYIETVTDKVYSDIVNYVEREQMHNPSFNGVDIAIERGDITYVDSDCGDYNYDAAELYAGVCDIIAEAV